MLSHIPHTKGYLPWQLEQNPQSSGQESPQISRKSENDAAIVIAMPHRNQTRLLPHQRPLSTHSRRYAQTIFTTAANTIVL